MVEPRWEGWDKQIPSMKGNGSFTTHGMTPCGDVICAFVIGFVTVKVGCWWSGTPAYLFLRASPFPVT